MTERAYHFVPSRGTVEVAKLASEAAARRRARPAEPDNDERAALLAAARAGDLKAIDRCAGLFEVPGMPRSSKVARARARRAAARAEKAARDAAARRAWLERAEPWLKPRTGTGAA